MPAQIISRHMTAATEINASIALLNLKGLTTSSCCLKTLHGNVKRILQHVTAQQRMSVTPDS